MKLTNFDETRLISRQIRNLRDFVLKTVPRIIENKNGVQEIIISDETLSVDDDDAVVQHMGVFPWPSTGFPVEPGIKPAQP